MKPKDPKRPKAHVARDMPVVDMEDPTSVVSSSECTGLFAFMPEDQAEADALEEIVKTNPVIVPEIGKE